MNFDLLRSLSVRDGKLQASVADCLIFRQGMISSPHAFHIISNFHEVFKSLLDKLNGCPGSDDLKTILNEIEIKKLMSMQTIIKMLQDQKLNKSQASKIDV